MVKGGWVEVEVERVCLWKERVMMRERERGDQIMRSHTHIHTCRMINIS